MTGFSVPLKFLDGTTLLLQNAEGDAPVAPDTINRVRGKGMRGGDLYVVWKIDMPEGPFDEESKAALRELLGGGGDDDDAAAADDGDDESEVVKVDLEPAGNAGDRRRQKQQQQQGGENETNCRQM